MVKEPERPIAPVVRQLLHAISRDRIEAAIAIAKIGLARVSVSCNDDRLPRQLGHFRDLCERNERGVGQVNNLTEDRSVMEEWSQIGHGDGIGIEQDSATAIEFFQALKLVEL